MISYMSQSYLDIPSVGRVGAPLLSLCLIYNVCVDSHFVSPMCSPEALPCIMEDSETQSRVYILVTEFSSAHISQTYSVSYLARPVRSHHHLIGAKNSAQASFLCSRGKHGRGCLDLCSVLRPGRTSTNWFKFHQKIFQLNVRKDFLTVPSVQG